MSLTGDPPGASASEQPEGAWPPASAAARPRLGATAADVRAGLVTAVAVTALGPPLGLLWGTLAPREDVRVRPGGSVAFTGVGGDLFVGADLLFVLLAAVLGLLAGLVAHARASARGWPVVVGLAAGGVLAGLVAVRLGEPLGAGALVYTEGRLAPADGAPLPADTTGVVQVSLQLRATGALVVLPLAAVLAHLSRQVLRPTEEASGGWPPAGAGRGRELS